MKKPAFCICEKKDADQLRGKLISAFVFATKKVQSLYFLNLKFQASSHLLLLYSLVCVGPGRKPERWFSHDAAVTCLPLDKRADIFHKRELKLMLSPKVSLLPLTFPPTIS